MYNEIRNLKMSILKGVLEEEIGRLKKNVNSIVHCWNLYLEVQFSLERWGIRTLLIAVKK